MIQIEEIHKSFDGAEVLKGISLDLGKGEVMALVGRSGYGKSVLLKHVAGLMRPDRGRILVDGQDIHSLKGKDVHRLRRRLGFLFQSGALFDSMTLFDNVAFPLKEKTKLTEKEIRERVMHELAQVGLTGSEDKYPSQISGGMVRRASIARALIEEPEIMLIDEPTTGLDPVTGQTILNLIDSCHERLHFTGIVVTHEIPKIFEIVDKVAMLHEGVILFFGTPQEIMKAEEPVVKTFISGSLEWLRDLECGPEPVRGFRSKRRAHTI